MYAHISQSNGGKEQRKTNINSLKKLFLVRRGRREEGSGWGTSVYLWWIHVDIWQNQYNIVKLKNKIKQKKRNYL